MAYYFEPYFSAAMVDVVWKGSIAAQDSLAFPTWAYRTSGSMKQLRTVRKTEWLFCSSKNIELTALSNNFKYIEQVLKHRISSNFFLLCVILFILVMTFQLSSF